MPERVAGLIGGQERRAGEAAYFVAFNATNAINYAYLVGMGLLLSTESYGLLGALFGLVYLVSALGNTVKVAVAKHIACSQTVQGGAVSRQVVMGAFAPAGVLAVVVGLAFLALSPALARAFHSSPGPLLWTSLAVALSVCVPAVYGVLQGMQRFARLGVSLLAGSVVRIAVGGALVAAGWGPSGALIGVAIGLAASGLLALLPATRETRPGRGEDRLAAPSAQSLAAILVASIAIAAPTSLDVVLVKHFFPALEAGMFTAVAVLGRIVLFVPLAISFIALPKIAARVSQGGNPSPLLWSTLAQTGILAGGAALLLFLMTSGLGWSPVGADISGALTPLHWYLPSMVAFALVVAFVYYQIGCGNTRSVFALLVPGIAAQAVLIILFHDSLTMVAQIMFAVNFLLLAASLFLVALPSAGALRVLRLLPRRAGADAWRPDLPPND